MLSYWQVLQPPVGSTPLFPACVDAEGELAAQHDALDAPAQDWQQGDILVQAHQLPLGDLAGCELRLGVYDPQ